jgi:DivIVA domain-containing protein
VGVIAAVLIGLALLTGFAVVLAMTEGPMSDEPVDRGDSGLPDPAQPDRALTAGDIDGLRFRVGLRGYRMDDVDEALDRIRSEMAAGEPAPADPES